MKLKDFQKKMKKSVFTTQEARLVCLGENSKILNLQLHQWKQSGDLVALKRGVYMFSHASVSTAEIAKNLYSPCYFSLEYVLSMHGVMSEAVFEYTLVTTKATRRFETPAGIFSYQTIRREAFTGFDSDTLMADKEKALVDWFYLNTGTLQDREAFWEQSRLEAVATKLDFTKIFGYARLLRSKKLLHLLRSFQSYATSRAAHQ